MRYTIKRFTTIDSTNAYLLTCAKQGAHEGMVVVADFQTKGRGRYRRKWVSCKGENLLFSVLLRPQCAVSHAPFITHLAAKTVKIVLERELGLCCALKKPNDVLIDGKKICGILTECHSKKHATEYVVIGMGININSPEDHLLKGATSVLCITGKRANRKKLLNQILTEFALLYKAFYHKEQHDTRH